MQAATEVELFTTADETKLQITLFVSKEPAKGFIDLCAKLQQLIPELRRRDVRKWRKCVERRKTDRLS
jgi:23S rRNA (uracil1939-C5)-methyltransferase